MGAAPRRTAAAVASVLALLSGCAAGGNGRNVPAPATPHRLSIASGIPRANTPQIISLVIANGKVTGGTGTVPVVQNSMVRLTVLADRVDTVTVQGYPVDLLTRIGAPVQVEFLATRAGTFQVRLRDRDLLLTTLVVS